MYFLNGSCKENEIITVHNNKTYVNAHTAFTDKET